MIEIRLLEQNVRYLSLVSLVFLLNISTSVSAEEQTQWHYRLGIHDFVVDEENSHTFGANMSLSIAHRTAADIQLSALLDIYLDVDVDDLDPDHIPVWFKSDSAAIGELYRFAPVFFLGWQVDLQGKRNTVSSVEKQLKLFPALTANYQGKLTQAQLKAGAGYYFLEIDDDVPKNRGYDRDDLGNKEFAYTLMGSFGADVTPKLHMSFAAQTWHDGDAWLEDQYRFDLTYQTDFWAEHSQWVLNVEHTQYNLDHYAKSDMDLPILPWDDDTLVRLSLMVPW